MTDHTEDPREQIDETEAADTIAAHNPSKSELMSMLVTNLTGLPQPELVDFCAKAMAFIQNPHQKEEGSEDENKASIGTKPSDASPAQPGMPVIQTVREDLDTVLAGQDLPADSVEKILTLFEAAVNARVALEVARVEDEYESALAEQAEELVEQLDQYIDYAAREFFTENEIAIENSLKVDLYEEFVDELQGLFRRHWVEIPEDRVDVAAELADRVAELEEALNDKTQEVLDLEEAVMAQRAAAVFDQVCEGLTESDREKLKTLVESVEFDGDEYKLAERVRLVREAHFGANKDGKKPALVTESEGEVVTLEVRDDGEGKKTIDEAVDPLASLYAKALTRVARKA